MNRDNDKIWGLYLESPWRLAGGINVNDKFLNANISEIKVKYLLLDEFDGYEIFGDDREYYLIKGNQIGCYCRGEQNIDNYVIDLIWNNPSHKGLFRRFLIHYLLEENDCVKTENTMTDMGFEFIRKLMVVDGLNVSVRDKTGNIFQIEADDIPKYMEKLSSDNKYSTFIIQK